MEPPSILAGDRKTVVGPRRTAGWHRGQISLELPSYFLQPTPVPPATGYPCDQRRQCSYEERVRQHGHDPDCWLNCQDRHHRLLATDVCP